MARMESGVRKRANGSYEKRFCVDGKRYSVYAATTKELKTRELERRAEIEKGLYKANSKVTLDEYFKEWIENRRNIIKESTETRTKEKYKNHIAPRLGNKRIKDIERREVKDLQKELVSCGLSARTINGIMTTLHCILADAVRDEIIIANPCDSIRGIKDKADKPKATETIHRALTEQEQEAFMDELRGDYYYPVFAFCFSTGVRIGEAAALTWADIDRKDMVIHIRRTVTIDRNGKRTIGKPKTATSERDIPLMPALLPILEQARKQGEMVRAWKVVEMDTAQLVFPSIYGKKLSDTVFNNCVIPRALQSLEKKGVHIERFTMHATRDTFATRFIEQGGTPQTLKSILGHSSLAMTMDLYAHVLPNTKAEEMERMRLYV